MRFRFRNSSHESSCSGIFGGREPKRSVIREESINYLATSVLLLLWQSCCELELLFLRLWRVIYFSYPMSMGVGGGEGRKGEMYENVRDININVYRMSTK